MAIQTIDESGDDLGKDFAEAARFTIDELNMNRALKISNSQLLRLGVQAMRPFFAALYTMIGWLILVWLVHTFLPGFVQKILFRKSIGMFGVAMLGCVWALIIGFLESSELTLLLLIDVSKGAAARIESPAAPSRTEGHSRNSSPA